MNETNSQYCHITFNGALDTGWNKLPSTGQFLIANFIKAHAYQIPVFISIERGCIQSPYTFTALFMRRRRAHNLRPLWPRVILSALQRWLLFNGHLDDLLSPLTNRGTDTIRTCISTANDQNSFILGSDILTYRRITSHFLVV